MPKTNAARAVTSRIEYFFIKDTSRTDGGGLTGLAYNTGGLVVWYHRAGDSAGTAITLAALVTPGTWVSGQFGPTDATNLPGQYELHVPDAAWASGIATRIYLRGAANMATTAAEIGIDSINRQDGVRFGLSALPASALNTAGGSRSAIIASGTAQSGTSTTIVLTAGDAGTVAAYVGSLLQITGGTGVGQTRTIAAYNAGTKTVTLATGRTFGVTPDATSTYIVVADAHPALNDSLQVVSSSVAGNVVGTTGDLTTITDIQGDVDGIENRILLALPASGPGLSGGLAMIGESNQLLDSADLVAIANALLTAAISPTVRPTIGTVAEALAAARMAAIGNKSRTGNVVTGKASDDTTTFSTLTFDSITTPLTETRS